MNEEKRGRDLWSNMTMFIHRVNEIDIEFVPGKDRHVEITFRNKDGVEGRIHAFLDEDSMRIDSLYTHPKLKGFKKVIRKMRITKDGPKELKEEEK